jgi:hypothetical protein
LEEQGLVVVVPIDMKRRRRIAAVKGFEVRGLGGDRGVTR